MMVSVSLCPSNRAGQCVGVYGMCAISLKYQSAIKQTEA